MEESRESTWYSVAGMDPRLEMDPEFLEDEIDDSEGPFTGYTRGDIQEDRANDLIQRHGETGLIVSPENGSERDLPVGYTDAQELAEFIDVFDHHLSAESGGYETSGLNIGGIRMSQVAAREPGLDELAESLDGRSIDIYGKIGPTEHSTRKFLGDGSIKAGWIDGEFGYEMDLMPPEELADLGSPGNSTDDVEEHYGIFEDLISSAYVQTMAVMSQRGYEFNPR